MFLQRRALRRLLYRSTAATHRSKLQGISRSPTGRSGSRLMSAYQCHVSIPFANRFCDHINLRRRREWHQVQKFYMYVYEYNYASQISTSAPLSYDGPEESQADVMQDSHHPASIDLYGCSIIKYMIIRKYEQCVSTLGLSWIRSQAETLGRERQRGQTSGSERQRDSSLFSFRNAKKRAPSVTSTLKGSSRPSAMEKSGCSDVGSPLDADSMCDDPTWAIHEQTTTSFSNDIFNLSLRGNGPQVPIVCVLLLVVLCVMLAVSANICSDGSAWNDNGSKFSWEVSWFSKELTLARSLALVKMVKETCLTCLLSWLQVVSLIPPFCAFLLWFLLSDFLCKGATSRSAWPI